MSQGRAVAYPDGIPKLWQLTIRAHRREVRDAILDTTAALVAQHGLRSVTMSQIAEATGIGRATLYKYFSGVEPILIAWHQRHMADHLEHLTKVRDQPGEPRARLEAILHTYAFIAFERHQHGAELRVLVHQREHVAGPERQLLGLVRDVLAEAAELGVVRTDVPVDELAAFSLHALESAGALSSRTAVTRLVRVVIDALKPPANEPPSDVSRLTSAC